MKSKTAAIRIANSIRAGLKEVELIRAGKLEHKTLEQFLSELEDHSSKSSKSK